jgi:hypothetical protein
VLLQQLQKEQQVRPGGLQLYMQGRACWLAAVRRVSMCGDRPQEQEQKVWITTAAQGCSALAQDKPADASTQQPQRLMLQRCIITG